MHLSVLGLVLLAGLFAEVRDDFEETNKAVAKLDASKILDESRSEEERRQILNLSTRHPGHLIAALADGLPADSKEEYRRIPWIWRVAFLSGQRNRIEDLKKILDVSLPAEGAPLADWQAVVIGGGLINGISKLKEWPGARLTEVIGEDPGLKARWASAMKQAIVMVDNPKVPNGTRYDAIRFLGTLSWDQASGQLVRYLAKGIDAELQMGAISACNDIKSPAASQALLSGVGHYSKQNLTMALDALTRLPERMDPLLDAIADGRIQREQLSEEQINSLLRRSSLRDQTRAKKLLDKK